MHLHDKMPMHTGILPLCTCTVCVSMVTSCILMQYFSDANEAEAWMKERESLVTTNNYGKDEASAKVRCGCEVWGEVWV